MVDTNRKVKADSINYNLPIICIPEDKIISFCEWFDTDIYKNGDYFKDVPEVFDEGYIFIEKIPIELNSEQFRDYIKWLAHVENSTFRKVEQSIVNVYKLFTENILLYFKFNGNCKLYISYQSTVENALLGHVSITEEILQKPVYLENTFYIKNKSIYATDKLYCDEENGFQFQSAIVEYYMKLFTSAMWYIALYKNRYKYEVGMSKETVREVIYKRPNTHQNSVQVITTSFYDLSRTPKSKVQTLRKKREGFEYSHQFDVRGHYRHYKSGKVIFIESFTKAKDKPRKQKQILLKPTN